MFHVSPVGSLVHSFHVEIWPKKAQFVVHASVGLHSLIQLLGVVEHLAGWAEAEVGVLTYPRLAPAPALLAAPLGAPMAPSSPAPPSPLLL